MAYKVIILYQLYMPSYFLGTFTEYPYVELFCRYLFVFGDRNWRPGRFCRSSGFFYH